MKVDPEKLRKSVSRLANGRPDRRKTTNLMATVRPLLPVIEELRAPPPKAWAVIAAALAEQGVTEKGGKPLTERRLTSVYCKLKAQGEKHTARLEERARRSDIPDIAHSKAINFADRLLSHLIELGNNMIDG